MNGQMDVEECGSSTIHIWCNMEWEVGKRELSYQQVLLRPLLLLFIAGMESVAYSLHT